MKSNYDEIREASHAGSWYVSESNIFYFFGTYNTQKLESKLDSQLTSWLKSADETLKIKQIKALISP